jgi:hypothetical protein
LFGQHRRKVAILRDVPIFEVAAPAIVRAVDRERGMLFLVGVGDPGEFNTVVMGDVAMPGAIYADTTRARPNYLAIGILDRAGASTDPLVVRHNPQSDAYLT